MTITRTALLPGTLLATAALALAGSGVAQADAASKFKPTAANLKHFVLKKGDPPDGDTSRNWMNSGSPGGCVSLEAAPAATRSYERKLRSLGFRRCASASFEKEVHTVVDENVTTDATNQPGSKAILMRDARAASRALPILRRTLLESFTAGTPAEAHSLPAPALGSEAPRGIQVTYDLGRFFGKVTSSIYLWRRGPVVGWVFSGHLLGDFDDARTLELARKLDARIAG